MKEGGSLFGGTCEHCEDRAPSGPRQDSVRTLSGLCQDSVRTLSGLSGQLRELHKPGYFAHMRSIGVTTPLTTPSRDLRRTSSPVQEPRIKVATPG